ASPLRTAVSYQRPNRHGRAENGETMGPRQRPGAGFPGLPGPARCRCAAYWFSCAGGSDGGGVGGGVGGSCDGSGAIMLFRSIVWTRSLGARSAAARLRRATGSRAGFSVFGSTLSTL